MTAAERRATAAKVRASRQAAEPAAPPADDPQVPASRLGGYVRTDPVRSTVDLPPHHHAKLAEWADELSVQLGRPPGRRGVTRQAVLAALVAELLVDETIAGRVRKRLREEYGSQ
jgi:hypothetical protein